MSAWATMPTSSAVLDNGQPPNLVAGHELERFLEVFVGLHHQLARKTHASSGS
jgi:hypothetical protein